MEEICLWIPNENSKYCGPAKLRNNFRKRIRKEKEDSYRFLLKTMQGKTLLNSVSYNSETEARECLRKLLPESDRNLRVERKTNYNGKFLFFEIKRVM